MSTQDKKDKMTKQGVRDLDHKFPKKRPAVASAEGIVEASSPPPVVAAVPVAAIPPSPS
jgi:hypothetical protein